MSDVYKMLAEDITENQPQISPVLAFSLVNLLDELGVIDYDTLKEKYLYDEEE